MTSTDFRNRLTGPPNSNRIRLTERFASPYEALCFHVFTGSDSPPGPSRLSEWQVVSLLVSNQTSFMQIKRRSKTMTCSVLMHKNKSLTWCHSPTVSSRIKQGKESCYSHRCNQRRVEVSAMLLAFSYCACPSKPDMCSGLRTASASRTKIQNVCSGFTLVSQSVSCCMQVNVVWYSVRICWLNILCSVPAIYQDI